MLTKKFSRIAHIRSDTPNAVVVEYIGDEKHAVDFPHGNAKTSARPYVRTQPSVIMNIQAASGSAQCVYQTMVSSDHNAQYSETALPRNSEQVRNAFKAQRNKSR